MIKDYLRSKISVPKVLHALLPREKIAAIIDDASLDEVVCLVAPYGYGKTLSVISWLRERGLNAAWLTLEEMDNSRTSFFASLSAAIMRLAGGNGEVDDILADPMYQENAEDRMWEAVLSAEQSDADRILVIDGFRFIHDHALLASIKDVVTTLLGRWRVIIISRTELPPVFNDLILKRNIYLITIKELAFSPEEIEAFFRMNGCDASYEDALAIYAQTEGWPVSLNVVLMLSRGGPVVYNDAAREHVMKFFETEIWADLDEATRDFLLKTSVLDRLTPAACNAVTDMGATLPILRWLFENGLFISKQGDHEAFMYHRVFRNFLLDKLDVSGIDLHGLYRKMAWRMFEQDELEQAFTYFFKAVDLYGLSRVIKVINAGQLGFENYLALTGCIASLKVEELRDYPLVAARIATNHFALGNLAEMQHIYGVLLEWIRPGVLPLSPEDYAECVWEVGWLSYLNPAESVMDNVKHNEWINYAAYDPRLLDVRNIRVAIFRFPSILRGMRDYCPILNRIDEFIRLHKEAGPSIIGDECQMDILRAEYAYELEKFAVAEQLVRKVMAEVESQQRTDLYYVCTALLIKITRAARSSNGIGALMARLEKMILKNNRYTFMLPGFHALEQRNRLAQGIAGQTEVFESENKDYMDRPHFYLLYRHMTLARALLSTGDFYEATLLLGNLERLCREYGRIMDLMEVNILKSVADHGLGHKEDARFHLREAISAAREYGFIRIFSDEAELIWPVLEGISGTNDAYIKSIVISCKKTLARKGLRSNQKNQSQSGLTKTELRILQTLHTDMSYKEIAFDNNIKLSTVRTHIHSIYAKLYVNNRISAVETARKMGLIE